MSARRRLLERRAGEFPNLNQTSFARKDDFRSARQLGPAGGILGGPGMPEDQGLSVLLQRAGRRDPGRRRRGAAAGDAVVEGLEGEGGDIPRLPRPGGAAVKRH